MTAVADSLAPTQDVTFAVIEAAARTIEGWARRTPILESDELNSLAGRRVLVKAENLQVTGSFKFRGAFNKLRSLPDEVRRRGVVAFSSGNHGRAVAAAARLLETKAVIFMPSEAPRIKIDGARAYGADVRLYDRERDDREALAAELCEREGFALVPPFDDAQIMAGQGTVISEAAAQLADLGVEPDSIVVPCSGGGLAAGCATAAHELLPDACFYTAEPEDFDDMARSLASGTAQTNPRVSGSICDALLVKTPGKLTLNILKRLGATGVTASDAAIRSAMATALTTLKVVLEPGGAAGLAAVLAGRLPQDDSTVLVIASGGNVDPKLIMNALMELEAK